MNIITLLGFVIPMMGLGLLLYIVIFFYVSFLNSKDVRHSKTRQRRFLKIN